MSHPGLEGWYPECLVCGLGHFGPAVCLEPTCHEALEDGGVKPIKDPRDKFVLEDGHYWQCCQLCDRRILSDGGAWGTYALCISCFNSFARAEVSPPTTPADLVSFTQRGVITWQPVATSRKLVVVNRAF
jgi:hypothetical protein